MSNELNKINSIEEVEALIAEEEAKKEAAYTEIGKLYYIKHSADCEEVFKAFVDELVASSGKIAECNQRILNLKGISTCPKCGANVKKESMFCTACGALLKEGAEVPAPVKETVTCSRCGSEMKKHMRFCTACGNPLIPVEEPAPAPTKIFEPEPVAVAEPEPVIEPVVEPEPIIEPIAIPEPEPAYEPQPVAEPVPTPQPAPVYEPVAQPAVTPQPEPDPYAVPEASNICPNCGKVSAPGMRFCVNCGTRLISEPAPAPVQDYGVRRCQNCGHISSNPSMPFCTECGTRLN